MRVAFQLNTTLITHCALRITAEAKAAEIVAQAEAEISSYKKQQAALNKAAFADAVKQADKLAEQKASERLAQLNADTDKETAKYVKNVDKAVKLIVEAN